jgi:hypothetical protein
MMNNHRPHRRFFVAEGWTCAECDHDNDQSVTICQGRACVDAREHVVLMAAQRRVANARYAATNGIKLPPAEEHGDWKDFLPETDA